MFARWPIAEENGIIPEFVSLAPVGDVTLMMFLATKGDMCYLNREMSCYRMFSVSSWSLNQDKDKRNKIVRYERLCSAFEAFNKYTNYEYEKQVQALINSRMFIVLRLKEQYSELVKPPYLEFVQRLSFKEKVYINIGAKAPMLLKGYKKIREMLR